MVRGAPAPDRPRHRRRSRRTSGSTSSRRPSTCATSSRSRPTSRRRSSTAARRASTSSPRRSATTRTRCASTTTARSATRASTRRTPATTSSWRSRTRHPSLTRLADRRPGVRRGLGHVLRADDARAGLRRRPELPARRCTPTRSGGPAGSSSTSGCTAARSASTRRSDFLVEQTSFEERERPGRGPPLHLHADLPAVVPARQGPAAPAPGRRAARASATAFSLRDVPRHAARATARCRSASTAGCCARRSPSVDELAAASAARAARGA